MSVVTEQPVSCPHCGEDITILVDQSLPDQEYVEDCQVCCRPIVLRVSVETDGGVSVSTKSENE